MTRDDVIQVFGPYVVGDAIMIGAHVQVSVEDFVALFGESDGTYESLCMVDETKGLGYRSFFDRCKDEGILN